MPRWLPLAGAALLAILVVVGLGLWKFERLEEARIENGGRPAIPACAPDRVGEPGEGGCLVVAGYEGDEVAVAARRGACTALLRAHGGTAEGEDHSWAEGRFRGPYLRDSLLDVGVLVETLETVTFWSNLQRVYDAVKSALTAELGALPDDADAATVRDRLVATFIGTHQEDDVCVLVVRRALPTT